MFKEGSHPGWPLGITHRSEPQIQAFSRTKMVKVKKSQKNFYLSSNSPKKPTNLFTNFCPYTSTKWLNQRNMSTLPY